MKIALISCTKKKKSYPCKAKEMYKPSTLFKKATAYIELEGYDDWYILSAEYGLLTKEAIISPYDVTLNIMKIENRKIWSSKMFNQLKRLNPTKIDFYAGQKYRQFLIPLLEEQGVICTVPLQGLQIGQQLQFYTKMLQK
jgi:hypothetical protein